MFIFIIPYSLLTTNNPDNTHTHKQKPKHDWRPESTTIFFQWLKFVETDIQYFEVITNQMTTLRINWWLFFLTRGYINRFFFIRRFHMKFLHFGAHATSSNNMNTFWKITNVIHNFFITYNWYHYKESFKIYWQLVPQTTTCFPLILTHHALSWILSSLHLFWRLREWGVCSLTDPPVVHGKS